MKRMLAMMIVSYCVANTYANTSNNESIFEKNVRELKEMIYSVFPKMQSTCREYYACGQSNKRKACCNKPLYLITVTRSSRNDEGESVLSPIMRGNEPEEVLNAIESAVNNVINHKSPQGSCKIIAFNEMFFSQEQALELNEGVSYNSILELIKKFSKEIPNSIVLYNVLYKNEREAGLDELLYLYALTLFRNSQGGMVMDEGDLSENLWNNIEKTFEDSDIKDKLRDWKERVEDYISKQEIKENSDTFSFDDFKLSLGEDDCKAANVRFLKNETACISGETLLFTYKKSTYCKENDGLIQEGYIYDLGDGYPSLTSGNQPATICDAISTEICFDYELGVRKNNQWKSRRDSQGKVSKLHVIQSNSVEALPSSNKRPQGKPILYADSDENFQDLLTVFGGMIYSHTTFKGKTIKLTIGDKKMNLCSEAEKIELKAPEERGNSRSAKIKDTYTIWVHKV